MWASAAGAALRAHHVADLRMEALLSDKVTTLEPASYGGGAWFFPNSRFLNDMGAMLCALAASFASHGGVAACGPAAVALRDTAAGVPPWCSETA